MKIKILMFCFLLIYNKIVLSQTICPVNGIITNPQSGITQPSSPPSNRLFERNNFDWFSDQGNYNNYWQRNLFTTPASTVLLNSPFYTLQTAVESICKGSNSDNKPENGWELLKKDFGYLYDGSTNNVNTNIAYFMLYNRYTGKLRIFGSPLAAIGTYQDIVVKVSFAENLNGAVTALFNHYGKTSDALNEITRDRFISSLTSPIDRSNFFFADFQLAYDPCTCFLSSNLKISFQTKSVGQIQLYGRVLATTESIDNLDGSPYNEFDSNHSFLASVYTDGTNNLNNVQAGMLTYKAQDALKSDYLAKLDEYKKQQTSSSDSDFLDGLSKGLSVGAKIFELAGQEEISKGMEATAALSDFVSSLIQPEEGPEAPSYMPSIIHGEMSLKGTVTTQTPIPSSDVYIQNPGNFNSKTAPEMTLASNPGFSTYNEVLGTFALLQTPIIDYYAYETSMDGLYPYCFISNVGSNCNPSNSDISYSAKHVFKFNASNLKYAINPVLKIDEDKTQIKVSVEVRNKNEKVLFLTQGYNFNGIDYSNEDYIDYYDYGVKPSKKFPSKFTSNFYSLEEISSQHFTLFASHIGGLQQNFKISQDSVFLKVEVMWVFKPSSNNNNTEKRSFQCFKYPVKFNNLTTDPIPDQYPSTTTINIIKNLKTSNGNIDYGFFIGDVNLNNVTLNTHNSTHVSNFANYYILGNLSITGSLKNGIGRPINLYVQGKITQHTESSIEPEISLIPLYTPSSVVKSSKIYSVNKDNAFNFQSFCSDNTRYKSNATARLAVDDEIMQNKWVVETKSKIEAFPNPTNGITTFILKLEDAGYYKLNISDLLGREVAVVSEGLSQSGEYEVSYNLSKLPNGIYLYTLKADGYKETHRLELNK